MSGIFKAPSDGYVEVPLLAGEQIVHQTPASYLVGGKPMWGGKLVLTNQRLLFRPLDVKAATSILKEGIAFIPGDLALLGKVVGKVLDHAAAYRQSKAGAIPTSQIISVSAGGGARLTVPPTLNLKFDDGRTLEIGILAGVQYPNIWPGNVPARDEMVRAIAAHLVA